MTISMEANNQDRQNIMFLKNLDSWALIISSKEKSNGTLW